MPQYVPSVHGVADDVERGQVARRRACVGSSPVAVAVSRRPNLPNPEQLAYARERPCEREVDDMDLGAFSVSLAVKDLAVSTQFYERLGFTAFAGDAAHGWLVLRNGDTVIGLFHGMFERNLMTFNPGWDSDAQPADSFTDVRQLQRELKTAGLEIAPEADEGTTGPAFFMLTDPDGNQILFDQHV